MFIVFVFDVFLECCAENMSRWVQISHEPSCSTLEWSLCEECTIAATWNCKSICKGLKTVTETLAWQRLNRALVFESPIMEFVDFIILFKVFLQTRGHHLWLCLEGSMFDSQNSFFFQENSGIPLSLHFPPVLEGGITPTCMWNYILAAFHLFSMHWEGLVQRLLDSWVWDNLMPLGLFLFQPARFTVVSRIRRDLHLCAFQVWIWNDLDTWCFFAASLFMLLVTFDPLDSHFHSFYFSRSRKWHGRWLLVAMPCKSIVLKSWWTGSMARRQSCGRVPHPAVPWLAGWPRDTALGYT